MFAGSWHRPGRDNKRINGAINFAELASSGRPWLQVLSGAPGWWTADCEARADLSWNPDLTGLRTQHAGPAHPSSTSRRRTGYLTVLLVNHHCCALSDGQNVRGWVVIGYDCDVRRNKVDIF